MSAVVKRNRLAWLLRDVAERLPSTDVGRERYGELLGYAAILDGTLGEGVCQGCGGANPVWFAPNKLWNIALDPSGNSQGDPGGILCPTCFIGNAERAGIKATGWFVAPSNDSGPLDARDKSNIENAISEAIRLARFPKRDPADAVYWSGLLDRARLWLYAEVVDRKAKEGDGGPGADRQEPPGSSAT